MSKEVGCVIHMYIYLSKEVWKLNFRQHGQMEKHYSSGRSSEVETMRQGEDAGARSSEVEKMRKGENAGARKGREAAKRGVFPILCGSGVSKSRLAQAAGAEPARQMKDEKLYAVVTRSTFGSKKCQITSCSDDFWKLRCRKSARRCGAKHMWK